MPPCSLMLVNTEVYKTLISPLEEHYFITTLHPTGYVKQGYKMLSNATLFYAFASPQLVKFYIENSTVASSFGLGVTLFAFNASDVSLK